MRIAALLLSIAILGCGGKAASDSMTPDADAGQESDARDSEIVADAETSVGVDAATCGPISGTAPFGAHLSGSGPITDAGFGRPSSGTVTAAVDVYFPKGRVPGGEVVLAVRNYGGGSSVSYGTLDSTLSARGLRAADRYCGDGFEGDLIGPTDGIAGTAFNNTSAPSDALEIVSGPIKMCATGPVPEQKLDPPVPSVVTPFDVLEIRGARPFARDSFASVTASTSAGALAIKVTEGSPGVRVTGPTYTVPTFSIFTETTFDLSGLRDVLGAPLGLSSVKTSVPTSVATDLGFSTMPPATAYVGGPLSIVSGVLQFGNPSMPTSIMAAIAFEVPAGKSTTRFRHRLPCPGGGGAVQTAVISPSGPSVSLKPTCSTSMLEETVMLPAGVNILVVIGGARVPPCNYGPFTRDAYELDQITFE